MEKFLKDRSYYENIFDHGMIKREKRYHQDFEKSEDKVQKMALNMLGFVTKMEDYNRREKTINEWMDRDRKKDEFYKNAKPPYQIVRCKLCNLVMELRDNDFCDGYDGKPDRVLFFYFCTKCKKGRGIYNTGEEFETEKEYCKKCSSIIDYKGKFEGHILIKNYSCESCGAKYVEEEDFTIEKYEEEPITELDVKMYGYTEKQEKEMIDAKISLNNMKNLMERIDEEKKQEDYSEKLEKLNKYNLYQLEEYINNSLEKTDFKKFKITNIEEVKTYIKCEFEVYYTGDFGEKSSKTFDKLITNLLSNTNWRLQKNKTHEKLGVLSGVLYGYENKMDLIELMKKSN